MQIITIKNSLALLTVAALLTGCVSEPPTLYQWGSYEDQVYSHLKGESPSQQIEMLEKDLQKAQAKNKLPPPGLHAHLGLVYSQTGNDSKAIENLEAEKRLFPESSTYINYLLKQRQLEQDK